MKSAVQDSHCSWCGTAFVEAGWPRACSGCGRTSYRNPLPVAVILLPVDGGLLAIRRTIEPHKGRLALPGGFICLGESWQEAAARELAEETGVRIDPSEIRDFRVLSAPDGTLLVFGIAEPRAARDLPAFAPNAEAEEMVVLDGPSELAFELHTRVVAEFFARAFR